MKELSEIFGDNIRYYRKKAGFTQSELGQKVGCTEKAVSKWESGVAIPRPEFLVAISHVFKVSIDALLENRQDICYYVGIDGGGTKTLMALADINGKVIRTVCLGPSNPMTVGFEHAADVLTDGIRELCDGVLLTQVSLFAGIAGIDTKENAELLKKTFLDMRIAEVKIGNDSENIVSAGLSGRDGISVIMGTGSNIFSQRKGKLRNYGGCGYLFDNGGNSYSLARDAIHSVLYEESSCGPHTSITNLFHEKYGCTAKELLPAFYRKGNRFVASFAEIVLSAYDLGDPVATEIVDRNMKELANLLEYALNDFPKGKSTVETVFVGGLTNRADVFLPMIKRHLSHPERFLMKVFPFEPVLGALRLAGADISMNWDNGIKRGDSI